MTSVRVPFWKVIKLRLVVLCVDRAFAQGIKQASFVS